MVRYFLSSFVVLVVGGFFLPDQLDAGSLTAEVDKTVGTIDDQFEYTLTVTGSAEGEPKLPAIDGIQIAASGTSTNIQMSWGKYEKEILYRYALQPTRTGKITIPAIQLKIDGAVQASSPITLTINAVDSSGATPGGSDHQPTADAAPQMFVERELNKKDIYVGEAVVSTVRFYARVQVGRASVNDNTPKLIKRVPIKGEKTYQKTINGQRYDVTEISEVLVPQDAGVFKLEGYQVIAEVAAPDGGGRRRGGRGSLLEEFMRDPFFRGATMVTRRASAPVLTLTVKALPEAGRRADFSGLVGDFNLTVDVSARQLPAGDTLTLTLGVNGVGSVESMSSPQLDLAGKMKIYPDQPKFNDDYNAENGIRGQAEFKYALVPLVGGKLDLGSVRLQVFNPSTAKYEDKTVALGVVEVLGHVAAASASTPASRAATAPVNTRASDLVEPKNSAALSARDALQPRDYVYAAVLAGIPFVLWLVLMVIATIRRRAGTEVGGVRRQRAHLRRCLRDKLAELDGQSPADESQLVVLGQLFRDYLGTYVGSHGAALTEAELTLRMQEQDLSASLREQVIAAMQVLERAVYSGHKLQASEWSKLREQLLAALDELRRTGS